MKKIKKKSLWKWKNFRKKKLKNKKNTEKRLFIITERRRRLTVAQRSFCTKLIRKIFQLINKLNQIIILSNFFGYFLFIFFNKKKNYFQLKKIKNI